MYRYGKFNWSELGFGYIKTDYNVRCYYRDGKWGELEVSSSEIINIHMAATCLHYGQESFEGLKAFRGKDGKIRVFRMDENAKRMQSSSRGIKMAELPVEMFEEAVRKVVKLNERFVPPYESGAALYIRPLMIGLGAQVGVKPGSRIYVYDICHSGSRISRVDSSPRRYAYFVSTTVRLLTGQVRSRSVVIMPLAW